MERHSLAKLQPSSLILNRYEIVRRLGTGSMGVIYACRDTHSQDAMVAMKILSPEVAKNPVAVRRFFKEIAASYEIRHPHVVHAHEYFRDGELVGYTMEFVNGGDLSEHLEKKGELPLEEVVEILSQCASGLQAIHKAGIVHRDLKPENILLTKKGGVKISDFGSIRTENGPKLTDHASVLGTIDYISPEYLQYNEIDHRSDLYALGVIAYRMISGTLPYKGANIIEAMTNRILNDPEKISTLRPDCPEALEKVVSRAMARDPGVRYQSAKDILIDLLAVYGSRLPGYELLKQETTENVASTAELFGEINPKNDRGDAIKATPVQQVAEEIEDQHFEPIVVESRSPEIKETINPIIGRISKPLPEGVAMVFAPIKLSTPPVEAAIPISLINVLLWTLISLMGGLTGTLLVLRSLLI